MAMRIELSPEESRALHEKHAAPPMTDEVKIAFRENRDAWAQEGCLPEGLTSADLLEIENQVRKHVALLVAQIALDASNIEKTGDLMAKLASLKRKKLIDEKVYDSSIAMLTQKRHVLR